MRENPKHTGDRLPVGRSHLVRDLRSLGVGDDPDGIVMVHASMSAVGWVVGGAQTVVEALLEALGQTGTVLALTGWEDRPPYHQGQWDRDSRRLYERECPPFDPKKARAETDHGRVAEAIRTWPSAHHSLHPVCAFAAVGGRANWLVSAQSLDEGYGKNSPLDRLVAANGRVLLLGAPLDSLTLLHLAEYDANVADKRWVEYEMPVLENGQRKWRGFRELDSSDGAFPYETLGLSEDAFTVIGKDALAAGVGRSGKVGAAETHLFLAVELLAYAKGWLEERFGGHAGL